MRNHTNSPPTEDVRERLGLRAVPHLVVRLRWLSRAVAVLVTVIGVTVLVGWLLDITVFKSVLPGLNTMKPNAALCFVLAGLALLGLQEDAPALLRRMVSPCAVVVTAIGLLTVGEYAFGWNLGIDQLLFRDVTATTQFPGRMSLITAWDFALFGIALALLDRRRYPMLVTGFVVFVLLNQLFVLVGHLYDRDALQAVLPNASVAPHTAASFVLLCVGILLLPRDMAVYRLLTGDGAGAIMARRLLPIAIGLPVAIGWLEIQGAKANLFGEGFGEIAFAMVNVIFLAVLILRNANILQRLDWARGQAVEALQKAYGTLETEVQERTSAQEILKALQEVSIELSRATTYDEVSRRAVELGRSRLGFDRMSLWVISDDPKFMLGTYGTDEQGQIRDERAQRVAIETSSDDPPDFNQTAAFFRENVPLLNDRGETVGRGWSASIPLIDGEWVVGRMYADNFLTQAPLPTYAKEIFSLYGAAVGRLYMQKRAEEDVQRANEQLEQRVQERTAALQASEAQYRQIVELAEEGVWVVDAEERTTFVNRRMASMLGYSAEAMLGEPMFGFMDNENRKSDSLEEHQLWDTLWETDFHFKTKEGGDVWALMAASPILDDTGDYSGALMLVTDITARKQIEAGLRESEERFRQIAENIEDVFFVREPNMSRMLYISPAFERMWGRAAQTWYDNPNAFMDWIHPEDQPHVQQVLRERPMGGNLLEYRVVRPDGSLRWVRSRTFPILDSEGSIYRTAGVMQDITASKQAEERIQESERRFRSLFEDSPISLWEQDFSEVKRHLDVMRAQGVFDFRTYFDQHPEEIGNCLAKIRVVDVNPASLAVYKASHKEELLESIARYTSEASYDQNKESMLAIAQGKTQFATELVNTTLNGEQIEIALHWSVMAGYEQDYSRVVVSIVDITERKQAQTQIEAERQLLQTVIDNQPDYVFVKDLDGRFVLNNAAHCRSLGRSAAELIGLRSRDVYPEDFAAVFEVDDRAVMQTGISIFNEEQQSLGEGDTKRWVLTTKVPLRDPEGKINGLVGISRDVTERKHAQAEIEAERQLLQTVIDNLPDYIFAKDTEGRFILSNTAHALSVGKTALTLMGLHARDLYAPEMAANFVADDNAVMQSGEAVVNQERQTLSADGTTRWVLTTKVPLHDLEGHITGLVGLSRDITQRRTAQEALRESEARFRAMNEASPLGVFLTDTEGECVYVNALHQQITGQSFAESLGLGWSAVVYPEDRDKVMNRWFEAVRDKTLYQSEHRLQKSDGTMAWVSEKAAAIYDGETVLGYVGTVEDITERIRAQEEIRRQQELYRILAGNLPKSAVLLYDKELRYLLAEGPLLEEHGFVKAEMEGKTLWEVSPDLGAEIAPQYQRALDGETSSFEVKSPLGRTLLVQMLPVKNPDGTTFGGMRVMQDITERKQAEATRAQLAAIVESSHDAILSTDMEGIVTSWNMGAQQLYGYSAEDIVGRPITTLVPRELGQEVPHILAKIRQGESVTNETVRARKDGEWVAVAITVSPLKDSDGKIIGTSGIHHDINERKLAEQRSMELQVERKKVDMLGRFVGDASHDLKTPLTIIKSSLYLMQKQTDPEKRQRHVTNIEKETQRMEGLLDEMLSMSWLDVSSGAKEAEPQDINVLVKAVAERHTILAESRQQVLEAQLQDDLPPVRVYRAEFEKALVEIMENALNYTPDGGQVRVATALEGKMVKISIQDSGIGIAPQDIPHIFERFYRADKARGTKAGGTGLGLSIAKKIVEDHDGRIEVESTPGEGTTFMIFVPVVME